VIALAMLVAFGVAAFFFSNRVPTSFLPDEDFGYLYVNMQLPNATSLGRTNEAARQVKKILSQTPGVRYSTSVIGFSLLSYVRASYNAFFFVTLKPWDERKSKEEQYENRPQFLLIMISQKTVNLSTCATVLRHWYDGDGLGLGLGPGDPSGDGLGDAFGDGTGVGIGLGDGDNVGKGDGLGEGLREGDGAGVPCGVALA